MNISAISFPNSNNTSKGFNNNFQKIQVKYITSFKGLSSISDSHGKDLFSFAALSEIPITDINSRSERDKDYINTLAQELKCNSDSLKTVMGIDELKTILKKASPVNFNPKTSSYMINLHTHTINSDGKATVKEILDEAEQRGKLSGKNFLISITDHDTLSSAIEALSVISNSPQNYQHIRFVPGIEPCLYYENNDMLYSPIPFDAIIYAFNPFDKNVNEYFNKYTSENKKFGQDIIDSVNNKWNLNANFSDALIFHPLIKTGGSSGFLKFMKKYIESTLTSHNVQCDEDDLLSIFQHFYSNQNGRVSKATPNVKDVIKIINNSGQGAIGIAHPCIVEINPKRDSLDFSSGCNIKPGHTYSEALLDFITNCGLNMIELNYLYNPDDIIKYPQIESLNNFLHSSLDKNKFLATGGTDSHGNRFGKILESRK